MSYYYLSDKQLATMITSLNKTCRDAATRELLESLSYQKLKSSTDQSNYRKAAMDKIINTFVSQLKKDASEVKADANDEKEQEKLKKEFPNLITIAIQKSWKYDVEFDIIYHRHKNKNNNLP